MSSCFHQLIWFFERPYRYRCLKCWKKLKIQSGRLLTDVEQKEWFNTHDQQWPWNETIDDGPRDDDLDDEPFLEGSSFGVKKPLKP